MSTSCCPAACDRVVLGTAGARRSRTWSTSWRPLPGRVAVGLDYRRDADGRTEVAVRGWEQGSGRTVDRGARRAGRAPASAAVIVTAIDRDGTLAGPDLDGPAPGARRHRDPGHRLGRRGPGPTSRPWPGRPCAADVRWRRARIAGRRDHRQGAGRRADDRGGGGGGVRTVRVIPCLDVDAGRVVKGVQFTDLVRRRRPRRAGRPLRRPGRRRTGLPRHHRLLGPPPAPWSTWCPAPPRRCSSPSPSAAGVRSVDDARPLLRAGADKVGVNTAAVDRPELDRPSWPTSSAASAWWWPSTPAAGRRRTGGRRGRCSPTAAARRPGSTPSTGPSGARPRARARSCSTSMDRDGTRDGFDLELTRPVAERCPVPVIASGGVGTLDHLVEGAVEGAGRRRAGRVHLPPGRVHRGRGQGAPRWRPGWRCGRRTGRGSGDRRAARPLR